MKISTDAVVLGALAGKISPRSILDIGVGTGVISMMLAQRFTDAKIEGVELDSDAYLQACENVYESIFSDRISFHHGLFQDFASVHNSRFDLIVSNPPYFPDHIKAKDLQRNKALHNDSLSFQDLAGGVAQLLEKNGEFWLILPPRQMVDFQELGQGFDLYPFKQINLRDKASSKVIRSIQGFSFGQKVAETKELYIKNEDGSFAKPYQKLLKDFLIIF
ncbi:tRNA1(Val) (adenine(37)-N6)-methyltransferase [Belliella marina]|uniref:tRNA1(Val) (adenine(37)-N6)-methyltransferase n=1 Tax=Belliella marina TaxID=1644146 RepID=A0ABW4VGP6_9BACT